MGNLDRISHSDPVELVNPAGKGAALILCEHASNYIPARYDGLGLSADAQVSHAAWDPGARDLALHLSAALDAPLVAGRVSRLVYDCNRPPDAPSAIPTTSELITAPGNRDLTAAQRDERAQSVYRPFCDAVTSVISARKSARMDTALITVHSFTPVYFGKSRAVEIGILHDSDQRFADAMLDSSRPLAHRRIEMNQPYGPADGVTHSLKLHGIANDLPNVMLEVRNDLLGNARAIEAIAGELLGMIRPALATLFPKAALNA